MAERRRWLLGLLAAAVLVGGCGGVPDAGPVRLGRQVPPVGSLEESDLRLLPPAPVAGQTAAEVVRGFLEASGAIDPGQAGARRYLTPAAAGAWRPDRQPVTMYADGSVLVSSVRPGTVELTVARRGRIGVDGGFRLAAGQQTATLRMQRVDRQWRIAVPPPGLLLSAADVDRSYRAAQVYYLDPQQRVVVPDRVLLPVPRRSLASALVRRLLAGPTGWLAPAVRTAFPPGTRLRAPVSVDNGVAVVDLSAAVRRASGFQRQALSAQLVWTLRQLSSVTRVEVRAGGTPLDVPGVAAQQSRDDWAGYDPGVVSDAPYVYVRDGRLVAAKGTAVSAALAKGSPPLRSPAVSADDGRLAALVAGRGAVSLVLGRLDGRLSAVRAARAYTPPSWAPSGRVWTVETGWDRRQRVIAVGEQGLQVVAADELLRAGPVRRLRLSRDGTRVAAVVGGTAAGIGGRLLVGRVVDERGTPSVGGLRPVLDDRYRDVFDVTWASSERLVALARAADAGAGSSRFPVLAAVDGSSATKLSTAGLPGQPTQVTAAPGRPLLVAVARGEVWASRAGSWQRVGRGVDPAYVD